MNDDYQVDQLNLLDGDQLHFSVESSGYLGLEYKGRTYEKVDLTRLIPFVFKNEYISVSYENEEKEFREIGVIRDYSHIKEEQIEIIDTFLEFKYYMPEITRIISIKDNMRGYLFVTVDTTSGEKTLSIRDWFSNFKMITKKMLFIIDADGNKYYCPDVNQLDKKSLSNIELFV